VRATPPSIDEEGGGMATMACEPLGQMIGGIDTHKHIHVAAVIDDLGRIQGVASFSTTRHGFRKLLA